MADELDFSLPAPKRRTVSANAIIMVLLLLCVGLLAAVLWRGRPGGGTVSGPASALAAGKVKELAGKLTARHFYEEAAQSWQEYLAIAQPDPAERAQVYFQIGDLLLKAEQPRAALPYFYRSEMVHKAADLEGPLNEKIKECFEKAGEFSALRYELIERTTYGGAGDGAGEVVAEIGPEKITAAGLEAMLEEQIEAQLRQYGGHLPPEKLQAQKESLLSRMNQPQSRLQFVQMLMAEEALKREALAAKVDEDAVVRRQLRKLRGQFLAQQFLERETASKVHVGESDLKTYYEANKATFLVPAEAQISHILTKTEAAARTALARAKKGEDFGKLAGELSVDEATKGNQGEIAGAVRQDGTAPGIGKSEDLAKKIFAAAEGTVLEEPFYTEKGWHVIKVRKVQAQRQRDFDEVKEEIYRTLTTQKRQELQQALIERLMDKYGIVIHQGKILGKAEEKASETKDDPSK